MALTDYDKKTLSKKDQNKIQAATDAWNTANASGDKAGMQKAAADAAAIRNNAGYRTDSSGNYSGAYSPYTGNGGTYSYKSDVDLGTQGRQQMAKGADYRTVLKTLNDRYDKAISTPGLEQYANDEIMQEMWDYINRQQSQLWNDRYNWDNPQPTYESQYNPQIEAKLNQILNRENFSYDVESDPMYQQYAEMYRREGDRAMKETMAEAAAGAGGMNSYAITAAQQAQNYYNGQLNDTIPQLYQLAYDMYLSDIDRQVQDLGLLQNADDRLYSMYRDKMSDYYSDKNFAYEMYYNDLAQNNYQNEIDYSKDIYDREWAYMKEQDQYEKDKYNEETAYKRAMELLSSGMSAESVLSMISDSNITPEVARQIVSIARSQLAADGIYFPT